MIHIGRLESRAMKIPSAWPNRTHFPWSRGDVSAITAKSHTGYCRRPHIPYVVAEILRGAEVARPLCTETGEQPTHGPDLVIRGGHIALLDEEWPPIEWAIERAYPVEIVRRILRANRNHFEKNLPSRHRLSIGPSSNQSRAGGRGIPAPGNHGT